MREKGRKAKKADPVADKLQEILDREGERIKGKKESKF